MMILSLSLDRLHYIQEIFQKNWWKIRNKKNKMKRCQIAMWFLKILKYQRGRCSLEILLGAYIIFVGSSNPSTRIDPISIDDRRIRNEFYSQIDGPSIVLHRFSPPLFVLRVLSLSYFKPLIGNRTSVVSFSISMSREYRFYRTTNGVFIVSWTKGMSLE